MNKIKSFKSRALVRHCLLVMVGMLCALPSWAFEVVVNGVKYEVNEQEQEAVVVGLNDKKSSTVEIQKYVSGYLVSRIESNAFSYCSSLTSINIPSSVTSIGGYAFQNCSNLKTVRFKGKMPPSIGYFIFGNGISGLKFYVPHGTLEAYKMH